MISTDAATQKPISTAKERGITPRVVVLALFLAFVLGYLLPVIDFKLFNTFLGATHLPPGAVGVLLILILVVNPLLKLVSRRYAFSRNETLTVYITCLFSSLIPGHGAENLILPVIVAPFYFATPENKWLDGIQGALKPWMTPALDSSGNYQRDVVEGWYVGLAPGQTIPWHAWIVPLFAWGALVLAVYAMLGALSVMVRAQWAEREALAFPLLRLPLVMTENMDAPGGAVSPFFRNGLMWSGFGIAVFIQMMRGLHLYFPDVPNFPLGIDTGALFTESPWNQIGWVLLTTYPIAIGITYVLATEVAFSLWFFYWFLKFQMIFAYYLGFTPSALPDANYFPGKNFQGFQTGGAFLAYVALVLWTAREHFKHIILRAFKRVPAQLGEKNEALSYPVAFWTFCASFAFIIGFSIVAGVRWDVALALWISYLVLAIALTRIAVEGGMLFLLHDIMPLGALARLFSFVSPWLSPSSGVVPASFIQAGIVYHMRGFVMPSFVQGFKLAHDHKIPARPLLVLISIICVISLAMSFWTVVHLGYDNGGLSLISSWNREHLAVRPVAFLDSLARDKGDLALNSWIFLTIGTLLTWGMMAARARFAWFPFHPIGYLVCLNYAAQTFWFSIFLGWLCKVLITRFGGHESYRKTIPLFLGLVLGDVAMMLFWLAVDGYNGRTGHLLMPN